MFALPSLLAALTLSTGAACAADWLADVAALEAVGNRDAALARVERRLDEAPDDAAAWRWMAAAHERLADQARDPALHWSDAAAAWEACARLAPEDADAALAAARAHHLAGQVERARAVALDACARAQLADQSAIAPALALALRAGAAELGMTPATDWPTLLAELDALREHARVLAPTAPLLAQAEAELLAAAALGDAALARLARALEVHPGAFDLHRAYIDLHGALQIEERLPAAYAQLVGSAPQIGAVHWYAGYAWRLVGDLASRERRNGDAVQAYGAAVARLREAAELEPTLAEGAFVVETQARSASGWARLDADDVEGAERTWTALADEAPELARAPDGLGRSASQGLGRLGGRLLANDRLEDAGRVSQRVARLTDEAWSWNNVAFLLREVASDLEMAGGSPDEARTIFQKSFRAYLRATELDPTEPRIVNDTALIQVYHLREDTDRAEAMLLEAVRSGEAQLQTLGTHPAESDRFPLAQAVGDAYQNLGFLHYHLRGEPGPAREYFQRSLRTDTGVRPSVVAALRAIDAGEPARERPGARVPGTAPVPPATLAPLEPLEPPAGGQGEAPTSPPATPPIRWERGVLLAEREAGREGRPAAAYHRVGGRVGPSVEYLQRYLTSEAFARATEHAVVVFADRLRHTFVDRRRDGRLVFCPRAPGLACAEHIACAAELERDLLEEFGAKPDLSTNGLFLLTDAGLQRVGRPQDTFERFAPPRVLSAPADARPPTPPPDDPAALARSARLADRRELERRVFEPRDAEERRAAVAAVGAQPSPDDDALLEALAHQHVDGELARLALEAWRPELGSATPLRALQSAPAAEVRAAAARALATVGDPAARRALIARRLAAPGGDDPAERARRVALDLPALGAEVAALQR